MDAPSEAARGRSSGAAPTVVEEHHATHAASRQRRPRPNIVLVTADDMALSDLQWMPRTRRLLGAHGVEMAEFLSNHPLCCPARAQILTGQYAHNNGVHDNDGRYGGYDELRRPADTIAAWLRGAGYRTAFVGKYLNGWELDPRPDAGWTAFNPLLGNVYRFFGFTLHHDGEPRTHGRGHSTDVIFRVVRSYIRDFSRGQAPFFIWASPIAPHNRMSEAGWRPPVPARRHRGIHVDVDPPSLSDPAFNEKNVSDKPPHLTKRRPMPVRRAVIDHRMRIRSLRSLDGQVARTVRALRRAGELADTYVFFTSDNGYLLGEHRMHGKNLPYEESLRVPLLVRGPGVPMGAVRRGQFGLVDLAPTFLDLADASPGRRLDGRSMLAAVRRGGEGYRHYLIQASTRDVPWWWRGVRSRRFVYVRYAGGFEELYDLRNDPHQLRNAAGDAAYEDVRRRFALHLERLATCQGRGCWSYFRGLAGTPTTPGPPPDAGRPAPPSRIVRTVRAD
jgi:arylsulfatase A-like enzyme